MAFFALYYIPPADHPFYQLGSQILGYDVRARQVLPIANAARERLHHFDNQWVARSQEFGFHLTIGDAIAFDQARTAAIELAIENILNCFNPANPFVLKQADDMLLYHDVPRQNITAVLLHYEANDHLKVFQAVVAAYLHRQGDGSYYTDVPEAQLADVFAAEPFRVHRVRHFYSPTPFDSFTPHFTLFNPYPLHANRTALNADLKAIFGDYQELPVESVCLLVKPDRAEHYHLVREFHRNDYPQPL